MNGFFRTVSRRSSFRWSILLAALCAASVLSALSAQPAVAQGAALYLPFTSNVQGPAPVCRMGVNITRATSVEFPLSPLRIGWYIDYKARTTAPHPNGAAYTPIISLSQTGSSGYTSSPSGVALDMAIEAHPGSDWIIGNEPDRRYFQNDINPDVYAIAFHDIAAYIRSKDPTARIFAGAIVQPTPLRLQYLDLVLAAYQRTYGEPLPADGWAIHNFILNERSCSYYNDPYVCWGADIPPGISAIDGLIIGLDELQKTADVEFFKQQIVRFRQWMADNGYRNYPLYVSEYGILMPEDRGFPPSLVNQYMNQTFDYMLATTSDQLGYPADDNRLVQRFAWYSTLDPSFNGSLFESTTSEPLSPPFRLTTIGQNYLNYTNKMQARSEFKLEGLAQVPTPVSSGDGVSVTLRTSLANAGNNQWPAAATITFYLGNPAAGGTRIGSVDTSLTGCGRTASVDFVWANVPPEADGQRVYARLQAPGVDAQASVVVVLVKDLLYLPQAKRS